MNDPLHDLAVLEGVPSAVTAARDAADAVLRDRGLRQLTAEQSATALHTGARDSAAMAGPEWEPGAVRLSTRLIELAGLVRTSPGQALARAHALLAKGSVPDAQLGRVRPEVAERIKGLNQLLTSQTKAPAIVVAAIAHGEVATAKPFGSAPVDELLGRAVEHLVLIQAGVDPRAVLLPEAGHRASGRAYPATLDAYAGGSIDGVRGWILHCCQALTYGTEVSPVGAARRFKNDQV